MTHNLCVFAIFGDIAAAAAGQAYSRSLDKNLVLQGNSKEPSPIRLVSDDETTLTHHHNFILIGLNIDIRL